VTRCFVTSRSLKLLEQSPSSAYLVRFLLVKPRKIAFVKCGSFSHINASVEAQLGKQFPECEVITLDVAEKLRRSGLALVRGLTQALIYHGWKLRADPLDCLIETPTNFRFISKWLAGLVRPSEFLFTFQTQSMWDASVPGLPHFVYTDHTEQANRQYRDFDPRKLKGAWWTKLETQVYHHATLTLTMSNHVTRSLLQDYGCPASQVIRIGAGSNAPVTGGAGLDSARYRRKEILFVGKDWERKGGPQLVAAFQKILQSHPDACLKIIGCSPELDVPSCHVLGRLSLEDVARAYSSASVFCLPTRQEPFGIVLIEAMLSGLAIVATDVGAVPDLVEDGENGQRIEVDDIDGLASALIYLLNNPEKLEAMGRKSAQKAIEHHTWESVGSRIRNLVEPFVPALHRGSKSLEGACAS
jgi:glycosyltransferase involved in cell wall biosynthesis